MTDNREQTVDSWYVVDWDSVNDLESLKEVLKAANFAFNKRIALENQDPQVLEVIEKYCVEVDPENLS